MDKLRGTGVALATPLNEDYSIDFDSLKKLLDHIVAGWADYLVVQGTTGESPVFSWGEKLDLLRFTFDHVGDKLPIVFGLGGNNTYDLMEKSKDLKSFDLAAILSASPYYNKPSQEGIIRHYQMLADVYPHPIILYNVPARTASDVEAETTLKLAEHDNIIAMKEASGDIAKCKQIIKNRPEGFMLLSGDDSLAIDIIAMGGEGVISVIGNIMPSAFTSMINSALAGNLEEAKIKNEELKPIYNLLTEEGNPSSLKASLEAMGIGKRTVKPPLFDGSDELVKKWKALLNT
ncbi:MAG: 4-hydroxy-tetrahydrodipicolinate synthase [Bacteroidota bacterium]